MKEIEVIVEITLKKKLSLKVKEHENQGQKVVEMINEMTDEECKQFLTTGPREIEIERFSKETVVNNVINNFDPIYVISGKGGQVDCYEWESKEIANSIKRDVSEQEIASIIAETFNKIHDLNLSMENFLWSAEEIYYYLN